MTSLLWAALFAALFWRRGRIVMLWCAVAVLSHFVLDVVMHPHDMVLWPHAPLHFGLGLWEQRPLWWFIELGFVAACLGYYVVRRRCRPSAPGRGWAFRPSSSCTSSIRRGCSAEARAQLGRLFGLERAHHHVALDGAAEQVKIDRQRPIGAHARR